MGTIEAESRSRPTFEDGISTSVSNLFLLIAALPSNFITVKINRAYNSINRQTLVKDAQNLFHFLSCITGVLNIEEIEYLSRVFVDTRE